MPHIFVEHRRITGNMTLNWDLAHHLYMRYRGGPVVIVAEKPLPLLAALRKQWLKIIIQVRNEYSRTLDRARKTEVQRMVHDMQTMPFVLALPPANVGLSLGVYVIRPEQLPDLHTMHPTIYLIDLKVTDDIRALIPRFGSAVEYET